MNAMNSPYSGIPPWRIIGPFGRWLVLLLLFAGAGTAGAQPTAPAPEEQPQNITTGQVVAVAFQGNHALSSDELATVTTTKVTGVLSRFAHKLPLLSVGSDYETLSPATLERDTAALNQYYHDHGFIDARSSYHVNAGREDLHNYYESIRRERLTKTAGAKGAPLPQVGDTVIFTIQEGPAYDISRVSIAGLESLPNEFQTELNEHVTMKTGKRWSRTAAASEVQRLTNILIEHGYPNARSDSIVVQHIAGFHSVNVLLYFRPGHRYRYGPVHIVFDTTAEEKSRVASKVILAQLYIDSGHWYKLSEVQRSEAALSKLGDFDLFRIALDTNFINQIPDSLRDSAAVPVEVFLRMKKLGQVPLGVSGGQSSQGFVFGFTAELIYRNLTRVADFFNLQISYQPFPTTLTRFSSSLDYTLPYIGLGRVPLVTGLGYSHQNETVNPVFTFTSYSAHAGSNLILSHDDNKTTLSPDFLIAYVNTSTTAPIIKQTAPPQQVNLIPSISYQDNRANDLVNPTAGNILSASFEVGLPTDLFATSPSSYYLKLVPQIKYYFDLSSHGTAVIATRFQVGATKLLMPSDSQRDPSLDRRFYGGGATSNRSWGEQSLIVSKNPSDTALLGGYNDLEFNLELRYAPFQYKEAFTTWQSFSSALRLVLFYDLGNVWNNIAWTNPAQALTFKMMAQTVGWGLRYNTFFGALRVDWGFKLYDPSGRFDGSQSAITPDMTGGWIFKHKFLSLGNTSNIHFGIGQAF